jgi:hypothetical protein
MATTPFEKSLTLNATSQMLELTKPPYDSTTAVAPSSQLENWLGYDVELPFLKSVFLQFKRPHILDYRQSPFSFHTDHPGQLNKLRKLADRLPRSVFYALPLVETDSDLVETLENTLFVKVECLQEDTSRVRVHRNHSPHGHWRPDRLEAKIKNEDWYDLGEDCWFSWEEFNTGLVSPDSGIEPWIDEEYQDIEREPVGVVLKEQREPVMYRNSQRFVQEAIREYISEMELTFEEESLEAGMFAQ